MSRRLRRWTHKFAGESGYQRMAGDLEVQGNIIGPTMSLIATSIDKLACATTTPVVLTITRCEGQYKGIILQWAVQYNLANLSHYELQVSSDQTDWYSLKSDGTGWRGTINLDTDVEGPLFVHHPIPFDGTTEEPVAVKLYYRARQKTILGVVSAWSAISSATTSLVDNGDVLANTLTGNKIVAGSISAREMSFGTDALSYPVFGDTDPASLTAHLFDLSQPDCVANTGILPASGREIVYAPATSQDEALREYPHPWSPRLYGMSEAIFATRTNLVVNPENLTAAAGWALASATPLLIDTYVRDKRLTRVVCDGAGLAAVYRDVEPTIATPSIQCIMKRGTGNIGLLLFYDRTAGASRGEIAVTWATDAITAGSGLTHLEYDWIDNDTVWVSGVCTAVNAANDNEIQFYPSTTEAAGLYTDVTAVQVEDAIYPSPYIDKFRWPNQVRPNTNIQRYEVTLPTKFVFKIKVKPWFTYDSAINYRLINWQHGSDLQYLIIRYDFTNDKFYVNWRDDGFGGSTERILTSDLFDDGTSHEDINQDLILFGSIDLTTQTGNNRFFVIAGSTKQAEDTDWGGTPDTLTTAIATLGIGHNSTDPPTQQADAEIASVKIWTWNGAALGTLNTEADIDRATSGLTSLFSWEGEDYDVGYKPTGKQGAVGLFKATTNLVSNPEDLTGAAWAETTLTPTLSDYYIDGKRFSKLLATAANGYSSQTVAFTGNAVKSVQCFLRRGTDTTTTLVLRDTSAAADRLRIVVTWATKAFTETTGSVSQYAWLSDDLLWIACLTTSVTAANTNSLRIEIDTNAAYSYITGIQAEDSIYPTPYTPTTRAAGVLQYPLALPRKFTALFWVRPWFNYDTTNTVMFLHWYVAANNVFLIYYVPATDQITVGWIDGGVVRYLHGPTLNSAALLNQHIMVAATIDLDGGQTGSMLKVYAGTTVGSDKDWGAAPDTKVTEFPTLRVGYDHLAPTGVGDSFLTDLLILPGALLTEVQCDEHFCKTRPWYSTSEVASNNKQVRIDRNGIRLHNAQLNITDWRNRQILISNRDGLLARDAGGKIIHDIPNAPVLTDMFYGGHILWKKAPNYLSSITCTHTDVATDFAEESAVANVDISAYVGGNTNVKGVLVLPWCIFGEVTAAKVLVGTTFSVQAFYCQVYNSTVGSAYQRMYAGISRAQVAGLSLRLEGMNPAPIPVVYNGTTPYFSWYTYSTFAGMKNANDNYITQVCVYLLGIFI